MNDVFSNEYINDLNKIKETITNNQNKAMVIVNSAMIMTYYEIGTIINKRKSWGSKYIQKLSNDLKEYGKGYSVQNLKYMSKFSDKFTFTEIGQQLVDRIPWGTIIKIIYESKSHDEMLWYISQTQKNGWSRSQVSNKFNEKAYERGLIESETSTPIKNNNKIKEVFKDTYVFDFLNKYNTKTEKSLTNTLVDNVIKFIQELGQDFAFVGKEYKIIVPGGDSFYIDILMYHLELRCFVVIEVKNRKFKPQDLGQLLFYVKAIDNLKRKQFDNETIGLVLCKDSNSFVAKTTLDNINANVGISKYKMFEELPSYLEKRLNKEKK